LRALSVGDGLSLTAIIAITDVASLGADLTWYALGRWWGPRLLNVFGQGLPGTGTLVQCAGQAFGSHLEAFQLGARFLPELNPIAAGMGRAPPDRACFTSSAGAP